MMQATHTRCFFFCFAIVCSMALSACQSGGGGSPPGAPSVVVTAMGGVSTGQMEPTGPCSDLESGDERVGSPCECGGTFVCENNRLLCQGGTPKNACGGCTVLNNVPGGACGICGAGRLTCNGLDEIICDGEMGQNVCGGCNVIQGKKGEKCGNCGTLACSGTDQLVCIEKPNNVCGGCQPLANSPGQKCGACGEWVCTADKKLACDDPGAQACAVVRFIAMGDTGEANDAQYRVAAGAQARCDRAGGCDGFIMLGDNIYDTGAVGPMDRQLTEKIDEPYANLKKGPPPEAGEEDTRARMPLYVSLGNHDLGGAGINSVQVQAYLGYARNNDWFYYPSEFWHLQVAHVHLISLHTNPLAYGIPGDMFMPQGEMVNRALETTTAPWTIAFGHHPYRSNGKHGDAGAYELGVAWDGIEFAGLDLGTIFGDKFRQWVDDYICNRVDFYLSGHDHNRQWLNSVPLIPNLPLGAGTEPCNTHFAVSGAGAKLTPLEGRGNDTAFEDDEEVGFLYMEFFRDRVNVEFCDGDGETQWSRTINR